MTTLISYKRYGEILFQKVALCYVLHSVQDGSSKNALEKYLFHKNIKNRKLGTTRIYSPLSPDQPPFKGRQIHPNPKHPSPQPPNTPRFGVRHLWGAHPKGVAPLGSAISPRPARRDTFRLRPGYRVMFFSLFQIALS